MKPDDIHEPLDHCDDEIIALQRVHVDRGRRVLPCFAYSGSPPARYGHEHVRDVKHGWNQDDKACDAHAGCHPDPAARIGFTRKPVQDSCALKHEIKQYDEELEKKECDGLHIAAVAGTLCACDMVGV